MGKLTGRPPARGALQAKVETWGGVLAAVTTRLTDADEVDAVAIEAAVRTMTASGIEGFSVGGATGEGDVLEAAEMCEVVRAVRAGAGADVPVLLSITGTATGMAERLASAAAAAGATGFVVQAGFAAGLDRVEAVGHITAVARAGGLPVLVLNDPLASGVDIVPDVLVELAVEPLVAGVVECSADVRRITDIRNATGDRYRLLAGCDALALESLSMGADGWVASLAAAFPAEIVAVARIHADGRLREARAIYRWLRPLLDLADRNGKAAQTVKLVEALVLGTGERCRLPRLPLAGAERVRVERVVAAALRTRPELPILRLPRVAGPAAELS